MSDAVGSESDSPQSQPKKKKKKGSTRGSFVGFLRELLMVVVGALILSGLLRAFVAQPFLIPSPSMQNTLDIDDRVVVQKVAPFHRGDIVVFKDPGNWLPASTETKRRGPAGQALEFFGILPDTSDDHLIKRVVGMPGDTVACCNPQGKLMVNGAALDESEYLYTEDGQMVEPARVPFEAEVPADRLFVMGDHRNVSADSRCHMSDTGADGYPGSAAFVPQDNVVGTAWVIVAPFDRWRSFSTPAAYANVPPGNPNPPTEGKISPEGASC